MANTVNIQKLLDGQKNFAINVYLASDGASGELSATVIVDVSSLSGSPSTVKIDRIEGSLTGFSAVMAWDATADVPFMTLPADNPFNFDAKSVAGFTNNAGSGVTGDVVITTTGFSAATDVGHITIYGHK